MKKLEELNFSPRPEESWAFMRSLIDVLSDERQSRLSEHLALVKRSPYGGDAQEYLGMPATFGLLKYGVEGLNALHEVATTKWKIGNIMTR